MKPFYELQWTDPPMAWGIRPRISFDSIKKVQDYIYENFTGGEAEVSLKKVIDITDKIELPNRN